MLKIINSLCVVLEAWTKQNINELCFKLLLAGLHNKSTEIDMNVNNTVKHIHQNIIQVFLLL